MSGKFCCGEYVDFLWSRKLVRSIEVGAICLKCGQGCYSGAARFLSRVGRKGSIIVEGEDHTAATKAATQKYDEAAKMAAKGTSMDAVQNYLGLSQKIDRIAPRQVPHIERVCIHCEK